MCNPIQPAAFSIESDDCDCDDSDCETCYPPDAHWLTFTSKQVPDL